MEAGLVKCRGIFQARNHGVYCDGPSIKTERAHFERAMVTWDHFPCCVFSEMRGTELLLIDGLVDQTGDTLHNLLEKEGSTALYPPSSLHVRTPPSPVAHSWMCSPNSLEVQRCQSSINALNQ